MMNAIDEPQNVVILGGTSEIGLAIARELMSARTANVILACRDAVRGAAAADALAATSPSGVAIHVVDYDAARFDTHQGLLDDLAVSYGDLDVVVFAAGILGDALELERDPSAAAALVAVNHAGGVSSCLAAANRLRAQGHGRLVVLSSVAGERVRRGNFVYGGSKAGLDGFAQGLADALIGSGAGVLIVRPGFVHSAMTAGMDPAPFATTPEAVAEAVARGLRAGSRTIWVPGLLRFVFFVFRHLPGPIWRKVSAR